MQILAKLFIFSLPLLFGFFWCVTPALADWPMYRYDINHSGATSYRVELTSPKWTSANIGTISYAPAVDSSGNIYVSTINGLTALDSNGNKKWSFSSTSPPNGTPSFDSNGNVYYAISGCNPFVFSLTPNGTLRWKYDLRQGGGSCGWNDSNAAVTLSRDKQTLYVGVDNPSKMLLAFNLDGTVKWSLPLNNQFPELSSAVTAEDGTIYIGTSSAGTLFAINPNGTIKWQKAAGSGATVAIRGPIIGPDKNIYVYSSGVNSGELLTSFTPDGTKRWSFAVTNSYINAVPAIKDSTVYLVEKNNLRAVDTTTGTLKCLSQFE